jgi:hypothetical protein
MRGRRRAPRRRRARQRRLDHRERLRERIDLGRGKAVDELPHALGEHRLTRAQRPLPVGREHEPLAAAVVGLGTTLDQSFVFQCVYELRGGGSGHARSAGEIGDRRGLLRDRPQREVLRCGQRRLVAAQEALDPPRGEGGDGDDGLCGVGGSAVSRRNGG